MPQQNRRQKEIVALAQQTGEVTVDDLADRFGVSPQTIRKDLNELGTARLLTRTHGGAILSSGVENVAYAARRALAREEKERIGRHAASLIPNDTSLLLNIGTTTEAVARHLLDHQGLMVVTNNIHVATILMPAAGIELTIVGGLVRKSDGGILGGNMIDFIDQFKVDRAVIGVSAIDDDGALLDFDRREVAAARAIIENARQVILVADAMKFTRTAPIRIGNLAQVDTFVTDRSPPTPIVDLCRQNGVALEIVDDPDAPKTQIFD
ncbi:DeoR/GlpR family DNA-binding transcription regulator [Bauldia sp.]|uniref:DeoR/GlpR family DNA-binding transcription regulator n=1 Tax=Bauldia sp. TaxID=2575872 RepID=UPI003BAA21E5